MLLATQFPKKLKGKKLKVKKLKNKGIDAFKSIIKAFKPFFDFFKYLLNFFIAIPKFFKNAYEFINSWIILAIILGCFVAIIISMAFISRYFALATSVNTMNKVNKLYVTAIDSSYECDVFFPKLEESQWNLISQETKIENEIRLSYLLYEKKPTL